MKEIHHLRNNSDFKQYLPPESLELFKKQETYRQYRINLNNTIDWYNLIRKNSQKVEFDLVEDEIKAIDQRIDMAQNELNWNSKGALIKLTCYKFLSSTWNNIDFFLIFRPMELFRRT